MNLNDGQTPPPARAPWKARELLAWLAVALLAVGIYLQHRRLEKLRVDLEAQTKATNRAAETRMIDRVHGLSERLDLAERQVRECMHLVDKAPPR